MNMRRNNQNGSATLEFAMGAALVLTPMILGMVDFGRYLNVGHIISRAAHEGAFTASRGTDPSSAVRTYVSQAGLDSAKVTVQLSPGLAAATRGDAMKVTVSYSLQDYALASWGALFPQNISTAATARHE